MGYVTSVELFMDLKPRIYEVCAAIVIIVCIVVKKEIRPLFLFILWMLMSSALFRHLKIFLH